MEPVSEYLGASEHINNTTELSAIGEACKWLLTLPPLPQGPRKATICFDSMYAYGVATRLHAPRTNHALAESVAALVTAVRMRMELNFTHVKGHSGIYGNEVADRLADRGSRGKVSPHCHNFTRRPPGVMGGGPATKPKAKPKPAAKRALRRQVEE